MVDILDLQAKNKRVLKITLGVVVGMIVLSFASVPLYRLTCKVTGWGGTTQMVKVNPNHQSLDRKIKILFNTNVAKNMDWHFAPDIRETDIAVGADGFTSFIAENKSSEAITGTAVYNVTPLKAGKYFYKTQCFCFGEQVLQPHQSVHMPVTFFVDPKIMDDRDLDDVTTITLSYTFFRKDSPELEKAMETFYNTNSDSQTN